MNGVNKLGSCRPDLLARPRRSGSTMSELFEAWFGTAADGWSPSTVRQNCSVLNCHLHHHIGSVTVGNVTPALIDALYVRLRRGENGARTLAAATVARIHVVMSSAFSQAMRWGWVWDNPAERAHRIVPVRYTRRDVQVRGSCHSGESFRQKGRPRREPRTTRYPCGPSSGGALRTDGVRRSLQPRGRCPATGSDLRGVPSTHRGSCRKLRR